MKLARAIAKVDANHTLISKTVLEMGASWYDTHTIPGELDGVIGVAGRDQRVEIKNPEHVPSARKLSKDEQETFDSWRGRTPVVVETVDDVINLINKLRRESNVPPVS